METFEKAGVQDIVKLVEGDALKEPAKIRLYYHFVF